MPVIDQKVGDTSPPAEAFLLDKNRAALDLSTATGVRFKGYRLGVLVINGAAVVQAPASAGHVTYNWVAGDVLAALVGWTECKWEVTDASGKVSSYPTAREDPLRRRLAAY